MRKNLRSLIREVKSLANSEENQRRQEVQRRLGEKRAVFPTPFNAWAVTDSYPLVILDWQNRLGKRVDAEYIARQTGELTPEYAAEIIEFQLLQKIFKFRHIPEDIPLSTAIHSNLGLCWMYRTGVLGETYLIEESTGAFVPQPIIKSEADLDRLNIPKYEYDRDLHNRRVSIFQDILEGAFPVVDDNLPSGIGAPFSTANNLRGVLEILEDMVERPLLVHRLMDFIAQSTLEYNRQKRDALGGIRMATFGCDEVSCDMLSPAAYEEFILPYELRVAEETDSIYYHSCGNLTPLFRKIVTIPHIQRVHVSPWSRLSVAIEECAGKVVLEKHLHPSVDLDALSPQEIRAQVKEVTDLGVNYALEMVVHTNTPGGRLYREVFYEETGCGPGKK